MFLIENYLATLCLGKAGSEHVFVFGFFSFYFSTTVTPPLFSLNPPTSLPPNPTPSIRCSERVSQQSREYQVEAGPANPFPSPVSRLPP